MDKKYVYMEYDNGDIAVDYDVEIVDDKCAMLFRDDNEDITGFPCGGHINWSEGHGVCESCVASYSPIKE